jgi:predicted acyltransferase
MFLFLMWNRSYLFQALVSIAVLAGVWFAYFSYPNFYPDARADVAAGAPEIGVSAEWAEQNLAGIRTGWQKNANIGHEVDVWLLNQVPRSEAFEYNQGGYQTINFIPSFVTMLIGLMCGQLLRSSSSTSNKLFLLILAGAAGIGVGLALNATGLCPLVKRIWTPSWTLYSTGWCCLILGGLYAIVDVLRLGILAWPIVVVGVNSLAIYMMSQLLKPWVARTLETHFGDQVFRLRARFGEDLYRFWFIDDTMDATLATFQPTIQAVLVGLVFWTICLWMYRQRIFIRI